MPQQSTKASCNIDNLSLVFKEGISLTTSTPLMAAISDGNVAGVKRLLDGGADIDKACRAVPTYPTSTLTLTPLQYAVALAAETRLRCYQKISSLLLKRGAVSTLYKCGTVSNWEGNRDVRGLTPEQVIFKEFYPSTELMRDAIRADPDAFIHAKAPTLIFLRNQDSDDVACMRIYLQSAKAKAPSKSSWAALGKITGSCLWEGREVIHTAWPDAERSEHKNIRLFLRPLFQFVSGNPDALEVAKKEVIRQAGRGEKITPRVIANSIECGVWRDPRGYRYDLEPIRGMLSKLFEAEIAQNRRYEDMVQRIIVDIAAQPDARETLKRVANGVRERRASSRGK